MRLENPASIVATKKSLALVALEKESTTAGIREDADGEIVKLQRDRHISGSVTPSAPLVHSYSYIILTYIPGQPQ